LHLQEIRQVGSFGYYTEKNFVISTGHLGKSSKERRKERKVCIYGIAM
jgi:hypothetical protein